MRISVIGWYGQKNVGDESFRVVLTEVFEGHDVEFVRPPHACNRPDLAVLGGGAVASPFYLNALPDCSRYAIGIDLAYESEADLLVAANFREVIVRSKTDATALANRLSCPVSSIPDLAFWLRPSGMNVLGQYKRRPDVPTIGVLVTDYVNPAIDRPPERFSSRADSFHITLSRDLDELSEKYEVMLVPCSTGGYGDDRRINLDLAAFMAKRPTVVMDTLSPQEMIDLIAGLDAAVCMRLHAHIFCLLAGTPFLSIDFTRKVRLLLTDWGVEDLSCGRFDGDRFVLDRLPDRLEGLIGTKPNGAYLAGATQRRDELGLVIQRVRQEWLQ